MSPKNTSWTRIRRSGKPRCPLTGQYRETSHYVDRFFDQQPLQERQTQRSTCDTQLCHRALHTARDRAPSQPMRRKGGKPSRNVIRTLDPRRQSQKTTSPESSAFHGRSQLDSAQIRGSRPVHAICSTLSNSTTLFPPVSGFLYYHPPPPTGPPCMGEIRSALRTTPTPPVRSQPRSPAAVRTALVRQSVLCCALLHKSLPQNILLRDKLVSEAERGDTAP